MSFVCAGLTRASSRRAALTTAISAVPALCPPQGDKPAFGKNRCAVMGTFVDNRYSFAPLPFRSAPVTVGSGRIAKNASSKPGCRFACPGLSSHWVFSPPLSHPERLIISVLIRCSKAKRFLQVYRPRVFSGGEAACRVVVPAVLRAALISGWHNHTAKPEGQRITSGVFPVFVYNTQSHNIRT